MIRFRLREMTVEKEFKEERRLSLEEIVRRTDRGETRCQKNIVDMLQEHGIIIQVSCK